MRIGSLLFFLFPIYCSGQDDYSIRDLKAGEFKADSSHIYTLPFEKNKKVFLIQAYESKMSHKGERALDFKIKKGTKVCAAREGLTVEARVRGWRSKNGSNDDRCHSSICCWNSLAAPIVVHAGQPPRG